MRSTRNCGGPARSGGAMAKTTLFRMMMAFLNLAWNLKLGCANDATVIAQKIASEVVGKS